MQPIEYAPDFRDRGLLFPDDFVFGAATAAYQIEGAVQRTRAVDLGHLSHAAGKVVGGDTGDMAAGHYHRLEEDLDLLTEVGLDAYRFSIAWPRIMPTGRGRPNEKGLAFYDRVIDGLIERGITPTVTLYHWDRPQALDDEGGWSSRDTAFAFAQYAKIVGERYGTGSKRGQP